MKVEDLVGERVALWFCTDDSQTGTRMAVVTGTIESETNGLVLRRDKDRASVPVPERWLTCARRIPSFMRSIAGDAEFLIPFTVPRPPPDADAEWITLCRAVRLRWLLAARSLKKQNRGT